MLRNDEDHQKDIGSPNAMDALVKEVQPHPHNLTVGQCPKLCKVMDHKSTCCHINFICTREEHAHSMPSQLRSAAAAAAANDAAADDAAAVAGVQQCRGKVICDFQGIYSTVQCRASLTRACVHLQVQVTCLALASQCPHIHHRYFCCIRFKKIEML